MATRLSDDVELDAPAASSASSSAKRLPDDVKLDQEPAPKPTTAGGVASSLTRGIAPYATGAGIGAAIGAPLGGVGAIPGALIGAGGVAAADLGTNLSNAVSNLFGGPQIYTPKDLTDRLLDYLGYKKEKDFSGTERMLESTFGGSVGGGGVAKGAKELGSRVAGPLFKRVLGKMSEGPAMQTVSGGLGGAAAQATQEAGFTDPVTPMISGMLAGGAIPATAGRLAATKPAQNLSNKLGLPTPQFVTDFNERKALKTENQARSALSKKYGSGIEGGAESTTDFLKQLRGAQAEGQPFSLIDADNKPLQAFAGSVYRMGGAPQETIYSHLNNRNNAQAGRVREAFGRYLSDESMLNTGTELNSRKSLESRPYWNAAAEGGSLAPLEQQYTSEWNRAGQAEVKALQELQQANQAVTIAASKQATAGNVYSTSGANREMREAKLALSDAQKALKIAQDDKTRTLEKLRKSQSDRENDVPGAIWSPYLERLSTHPNVQRGLRKGYAMQSRETAGRNLPFDPMEIVQTPDGKIIKVPNMRAWMVAKEGLDAAANDPKLWKNGRPTKDAVSYMILRDGLVGELDRLNPEYKVAREHWGGYETSLRALRDGKNSLKEATFTPEELKEYYGKLSESDRHYFQIGLADELRTKLRKIGDNQNRVKMVNDDVRERLRAVFDDEEKASQFMDFVQREGRIKQTKTNVAGGAQTAERLGADSQNSRYLSAASDLARSGGHFAHSSIPYGIGYGLRGLSRLMHNRPNVPRNQAIADLLVSPDIAALIERGQSAQGKGRKLLPLEPLPPSLASQFSPGAFVGSGLSLGNQPPKQPDR